MSGALLLKHRQQLAKGGQNKVFSPISFLFFALPAELQANCKGAE